jgi:hypothetical protein
MQTSLGITTHKFLSVPDVNALIRELDAAFTAGIFRVRAQRPQPIHMLRQASYHELEMRRRYICQRRTHGYHTEQINIRRVKRELIAKQYAKEFAAWLTAQANEQIAQEMLDAGHAQQEQFRLLDRVNVAIAYGQVAEMVNEMHETEGAK